jgi:hypothetical protein
MQFFPEVLDGSDLDMGQKDLSVKIARLSGRVTALENKPAPSPTPKGGWVKYLFRAITVVIPLVGLAIMLGSWIEPHLRADSKSDMKNEVTDQLRDPLKQIGDIAGDVREIKGKLDILAPLIEKLTAQRLDEARTLSPKDLIAHLPELRNLATIARTEKITVKPEAVAEVGKKLVDARSADAWNTAVNFLNYKSFLNVLLSVRVNSVVGTGTLQTKYIETVPTGQQGAHFSIAGVVPREQAAQFLTIGGPDPNSDNPLGNDWILASDGSLIIDNIQMKKVIFRNVHVVYNGGPLRMQDVYFLDCTFEVRQRSNGEALAVAVLNPSPATTFTAS